jgi:hypothetical protein
VDSRDVARGHYEYEGEDSYWYTARLRLLQDIPSADLDTAVFRSVLGLRLSAASLWEALPWSWLVDYFINVGDYLDASRGGIKYGVTHQNLMCHQTIHGYYADDTIAEGFYTSWGPYIASYKGRRQPSLVTPYFAFRPIFTDGMKSILGALATASVLRGFRK